MVATTPGGQGGTPAVWPTGSAIAAGRDAVTVVMFVHPECPCSHASLRELAMALDNAPPHRTVVAFADEGLDAQGIDPTASDSWQLAAAIPDAVRFVDHDNAEAARFGAQTSGFVVAYDRAGELRFAGGVTGSRGHVGDNIGRRQLAAAVAAADDTVARHPVFGCGLETP